MTTWEISSSSMPKRHPEQIHSTRKLPTRIFRSPCCRSRRSRVTRGERCRMRSSAGISLSSSSVGWRSAAWCTVASRSRSKRARERRSSSSDATVNTPANTRMNATIAMISSIDYPLASWRSLDLQDGIKQRGTQPAPTRRQPVSKFRTDTRRFELPLHLPTLTQSFALKRENVLHGNHVRFHAGHFGNRDDFARAIRETRDLHHRVNGRCDLLTYRALRDIQVRHGDHVLNARQRITLRVRVHRGKRTLVTGIHGLQHVEC